MFNKTFGISTITKPTIVKYLAHISRILVGIEFIFSGFVKVVDPYGTGLKLQEYFEVFAEDLPQLSNFFHFFAGNSLTISFFFCSIELILGVALLFNFRMKITSWVVLFFMIFFTFLTFYSAYFNKVTDCGCFGDFMKLKPWVSFYKDIISLFFILIIFFYRKNYGKSEIGTPMVLISTILAFGIGIYGIRYLPLVDFLPYAVGKSIPDQMKRPEIKPIINYVFLYKSSNKKVESKEFLLDTARYKYSSSEVLNQEDLMPKITDFSLTDSSGNDVTSIAFEGKKLLIILKKKKDLVDLNFDELNSFAKIASRKGLTPLILTSMPSEDFKDLKTLKNIRFEVFTSDEKVLKTIARTNPCIVVLNEGTVVGKWTINNIPSIEKVNDLITDK